MDEALIDLMQRWVATVAVGASALRNQGAEGVIDAARSFLSRLDLRQFSASNEQEFRDKLDCETEHLRRAFPRGARHWGTARKAINLFLRDAFYNYELRLHFLLTNAEPFYEVALDSYVAAELKRQAPGEALPRWRRLKDLTPEASEKYQQFALSLAEREGIPRVHLDAKLWLDGRDRGPR